jgi:hypothetical protein
MDAEVRQWHIGDLEAETPGRSVDKAASGQYPFHLLSMCSCGIQDEIYPVIAAFLK